jgi:hypothetical protein
MTGCDEHFPICVKTDSDGEAVYFSLCHVVFSQTLLFTCDYEALFTPVHLCGSEVNGELLILCNLYSDETVRVYLWVLPSLPSVLIWHKLS